MKKILKSIALIITFLLLLAMAVFAVSIFVFLIQGNFTSAADSFYNLVLSLIILVIVAVLSDEHSN